MNSRIKLVIITIALVIIGSCFVACSSKGLKEEDIIGKWHTYTTDIVFEPNGTYRCYEGGTLTPNGIVGQRKGEGSWKIDGNTVITVTSTFGRVDYTYEDGKLITGSDEFSKR